MLGSVAGGTTARGNRPPALSVALGGCRGRLSPVLSASSERGVLVETVYARVHSARQWAQVMSSREFTGGSPATVAPR